MDSAERLLKDILATQKKVLAAQLAQVALLQSMQATLMRQVETSNQRDVDWSEVSKLLETASKRPEPRRGSTLETFEKLGTQQP